jgi:hypothetical protein
MAMVRFRLPLVIVLTCGVSAVVAARQQTPPPPKPLPFPTTGQPTQPATTTTTKPVDPPATAGSTPTVAPLAAAPVQPSSVPTEALLGVKIYPSAEYLESFDVGRNQRCYLFGTNTPFVDIVQYYKTVNRGSGRELFKVPAMQQWDLDKFDDKTMAVQPTLVVKDYSSGVEGGYLFVNGMIQKRFKTIIQIVPAGRQ